MGKIKNFIKKLKPKSKYLLGILAIAIIVSQSAFALTKLSAYSPRFNFLQGDHEMFRGANKTNDDSVWRDPVSGNAGDTFEGIIYYHNGVIDTIAENTRIKVSIPAQTFGNTATLSATISADNTETVSDTIIDGQIVGLSGLTVNLNEDANLELVPGSVMWYPDQTNNQDVAVVLPNGQTGDEITSANGVNIGDINGCWQYSGYLAFQFKSDKITAPALDVEKSVRNNTRNETNFFERTNGWENDLVEFKIITENSGTATAENVILKDTLPADLTFVSASMKIYRNGSTVAENLSDQVASAVFADGWNIGDLPAGAISTVYFSASAPTEISVARLVTNIARVTSGSLSDLDEAKVNLLPTEALFIVINKNAKNLTSGQLSSPRVIAGREVLALDAVAGETIEYTLITRNSGNAVAGNYQIQDGISDILEYGDVISVSNSGSVIAGTVGNDATLVSYPAVTIAVSETVVRTFTVKVKNPLPANTANGFSFDMQMYNRYGDEVIVLLSRPTPPAVLPLLHLDKTVRNFTINETNFVESNSAIAGDTVEYLIAFSNSGNGSADMIRIIDRLPDGLFYLTGSTVISINGEQERSLPDGITADGVLLESLSAGSNGYIRFKVITNRDIRAGIEFVNTADLIDNGVTISDNAKTVIKAPVMFAVVKTLPKTGADNISVALIVAVALSGMLFLAVRKF